MTYSHHPVNSLPLRLAVVQLHPCQMDFPNSDSSMLLDARRLHVLGTWLPRQVDFLNSDSLMLLVELLGSRSGTSCSLLRILQSTV